MFGRWMERVTSELQRIAVFPALRVARGDNLLGYSSVAW